MILEPRLTSNPVIHPVTERHHYVRESALGLLMLRISDSTDILGLVALPTYYIPSNQLLLLPLPGAIRFLLSTDPAKPPRAFTRQIVERAALNLIVKTKLDYDLEVSLILIKDLVSDVILA